MAKHIDDYGADYAYIWYEDDGDWSEIKNTGIRSMVDQLANQLASAATMYGPVDENKELKEENMNMILDKVLDNETKIIISVISAMIWIYFRKLKNYCGLSNKSLLSVILVGCWTYLNYKEPLFLPIGLSTLYLYSEFYDDNKNFKLN